MTTPSQPLAQPSAAGTSPSISSPHAPVTPACPEPFAWTVLSHLVRPQGRKGELLGELLTDFPDRFLQFPRIFLAKPGFEGPPEQAEVAEITSCWLPTGRSRGRVVLGFQNITSINEAERLCGLDVLIQSTDRLPLDDDSTYIDDLVGCELIDHRPSQTGSDVEAGERWVIGVVQDVDFSTTPDGQRLDDVAPLLIVVTRGGYEVVIPFAADFLVHVDTTKRQIAMRIPRGLLEVYGVPEDDPQRLPPQSGAGQ